MHFVCHDGPLIDEMLRMTLETGERINRDVKITALCPSVNGEEPMAEFSLTLSIKKQLKNKLLNIVSDLMGLYQVDFLNRNNLRAV